MPPYSEQPLAQSTATVTTNSRTSLERFDPLFPRLNLMITPKFFIFCFQLNLLDTTFRLLSINPRCGEFSTRTMGYR